MSSNLRVTSLGRLVDALAARGQYYFTTDEAVAATGASVLAVRAALRRLKTKGIIADPHRSFHVIVPPEYRHLGCLPPEQFVPQLMDHLGLSYYASLLTALAYHHRELPAPQAFQVMTKKNRPALTCGLVGVEFVARTNVDLIPTVRIETPRGQIRVSTLEATAFDLIGYGRYAGGIDAVAEALNGPTDSMEGVLLPAVASRSPVPWAQRLGHIISQVATPEMVAPLAAYVRRHARATVALDPDQPTAGAPRDREWRVFVNRKIVLYP